MAKLLEHDPLGDVESILRDGFYGRASITSPKAKPAHYKIICISMYKDDIERLNIKVAQLKQLGHSKANKSSLIRYALDAVDLTKMPKGY